MTDEPILAGILVAELGGREGVATAGTLLAQLGATVVTVEPRGARRPRDAHRAQFTAGKLSIAPDFGSREDAALLERLADAADIVLVSGDIDDEPVRRVADGAPGIVCDISAFGRSGPDAGRPFTEMQVQAVSGLMDTTGEPDGPPVPIGVPIVGHLSGTYAAAATLAALRVRRLQGPGQRVEISMFECAFLTLNAFLSGVLTGQAADRSRMGNRHPTVAPWNVYPTADGWVLICVGNDKQWERLYALIGRPGDPARFENQRLRVANVEALDEAIIAWSSGLSTEECVRELLAIDIPAGPIAPIDQYPREANIDYRGMIRTLFDPVAGHEIFVSGSPLRLSRAHIVQPEAIPAPGADRAAVEEILAGRPPLGRVAVPEALASPLAGLRVVELGQYTSAPLCSRHLAHLGAEVIKIEQPGGDAQRTWVPHVGGQSATFRLNNTDKRSVVVDLRSPDGQETLAALIRTADVLIENMRPGALAKYGFSADAMSAINPRLVYADISGFGADSVYEGRPAYDTVVQAMSGFMAAVRPGGVPLKSGISASDMLVAELGIVGILAALDERERTGLGQHVDLSMQDVTCWATAPNWNVGPDTIEVPHVVRCADGYVMAGAGAEEVASALSAAGLSEAALAGLDRAEAAATLMAAGLSAASVQSIREAAEMAHTRARRTWFIIAENGLDWPVLACPLRLELTPPSVTRLIPQADADREAILKTLGRAVTEGATS